MSEVPAGELPTRTAEPDRAMTYRRLESRLIRLERLERSDADMERQFSHAYAEQPLPPTRTSVVFSDEPCEGCGGQHPLSR